MNVYSFYQFIKILDTATGTGVLYARLNPLNKLHPVDSVWRTSTHWLLVKIISRTARCQRALFIYFSPPGKSESRAERYTAVWRLVAPARQSGPGEIITWRRSLPGDHLLDKQLRDLRHPLLFIHYNYCKVWIRETTGSAPRRKEEGGGGGIFTELWSVGEWAIALLKVTGWWDQRRWRCSFQPQRIIWSQNLLLERNFKNSNGPFSQQNLKTEN